MATSHVGSFVASVPPGRTGPTGGPRLRGKEQQLSEEAPFPLDVYGVLLLMQRHADDHHATRTTGSGGPTDERNVILASPPPPSQQQIGSCSLSRMLRLRPPRLPASPYRHAVVPLLCLPGNTSCFICSAPLRAACSLRHAAVMPRGTVLGHPDPPHGRHDRQAAVAARCRSRPPARPLVRPASMDSERGPGAARKIRAAAAERCGNSVGGIPEARFRASEPSARPW